MDLMFTIKDDRIFPYGAESINTGSLNYYKCRFDFNDSWNGLSKFAIFKSGNEYYGPQLIEEGSCPVPSEVFQSPGSFFAGVYGTAETGDAVIKRIVTGWCRINVSDGAYNSDTTAPEPPEADVWEEYMAYLGKTIENSVPQIADNGNWLIWDPEEKEYADSGKPSRGIQGETGPQGAQGEKGDKGDKGDTGMQGVQGEKGDTGEPGYTPQRGVDYWTQSDKAAIAEDISAEVVQQTAGMAKISELAALEEELDAELEQKQGKLSFDNTPTQNSTNPVTSGGVKTALDEKVNAKIPTNGGATSVNGGSVFASIYEIGDGHEAASVYFQNKTGNDQDSFVVPSLTLVTDMLDDVNTELEEKVDIKIPTNGGQSYVDGGSAYASIYETDYGVAASIYFQKKSGDGQDYFNVLSFDAVTSLLGGKQDTLTFDSAPTQDSTNPVTSGGIKSALDVKANSSDVYTKAEIDSMIGDIEDAADGIIALQESYIGGGTA